MNPQLKNKIVLVGFMGTGKSTASRLLADRLGWRQVDSDDEIVRAEGRSISSIFAEDGEDAFRSIETQVLSSLLCDDAPAVIATGGGAVLKRENVDLMLKYSYTVALTASEEIIIKRVQADTARPLLQGNVQERVSILLEQRKHAYDFAHLAVNTSDMTIEEVVTVILNQYSVEGDR